MSEKKQKSLIKIWMILGVAILLFAGAVTYFFLHNKSYKNEAIEGLDAVYLNGVKYVCVSKPDECTITDILICKTDTGMKLYEIEEYPDYQYVAGYRAWDGEIYKRAD